MSETKSLDLDQLKTQAKELLKQARAAEPQALERFRVRHPEFRQLAGSPQVQLADAQLVLARENGYPSWAKLKEDAHFQMELRDERRRGPALLREAQKAVIVGDLPALEGLLKEYEEAFRDLPPASYGLDGEPVKWAKENARDIIAWNNHFDSWSEFESFQQGRSQKGSPIARFEAAVEAIIVGDVPKLQRLLHQDPGLIRARSLRRHHSTLLHYVGANGVEGYRQKTPKNAVEVLRVLLDAGADVESIADMYGGSTTLGLVATSIHPVTTGVQEELMEVLMQAGAAVDGGFEEQNRGGYTRGAVVGCLANGRKRGAEVLAENGARLDLEGAAGVGYLDVVASFFDEDGTLKPPATETQMIDGCMWACEYGRLEVLRFLLDRGFDVMTVCRRGYTGLHMAGLGAHPEVAQLLIDAGARLDIRDTSYDGTPLGWAMHGWQHASPEFPRETYYAVVEVLVKAGAPVPEGWFDADSNDEFVKMLLGDSRMLAILRAS